jgi:hypothetical protein
LHKPEWVTTNLTGGNITAGDAQGLIYRRPVIHESVIGKGYRPLKLGESIEPGDQFWESGRQLWKDTSADGMDYTSSTIFYRRKLKNNYTTMLNGYEVISTPYMWGLLIAAGEDTTKIAVLEEKMCLYYRFGKFTPTGNWREARIIGTKHTGTEYETVVSVKFVENWHSYFVRENSAGFNQLVMIECYKDQPVPNPPPVIKRLPTTDDAFKALGVHTEPAAKETPTEATERVINNIIKSKE